MWYYFLCENDLSTLLYNLLSFLKLFSNLIILTMELKLLDILGVSLFAFLHFCVLMIVWDHGVRFN